VESFNVLQTLLINLPICDLITQLSHFIYITVLTQYRLQRERKTDQIRGLLSGYEFHVYKEYRLLGCEAVWLL
jgi:hypothetical protein